MLRLRHGLVSINTQIVETWHQDVKRRVLSGNVLYATTGRIDERTGAGRMSGCARTVFYRLEPFPMRRIALFGLLLSLTGCSGFGQFLGDTHTFNAAPNMPPGDSENMRRAAGEDTSVKALTPEPGNIWPPPAGPVQTLMDLETQNGQIPPSGAPPAIPGVGGALPSVPNGGLGAEPPMAMPKSTTMPSIVPPSGKSPATYPTLQGPAVTTGTGSGYSTTTSPGGGESIVVPNGNGTSTIIHPNGTVETVPTPK
jgi:hypothetical protein